MLRYITIRISGTRLNHKGQAAIELTVFGFLIVVALSVLTMYGQQFELQQQAKMEAFRRAIKLSYDKNGSVAYTLKKDVRFIDVLGAYGKGQASSVAGMANVMWQKGMAGRDKNGKDSSFGYYAVNDHEFELPRYGKTVVGFDGSERDDVKFVAGVWREEIARKETFEGAVVKKEAKARYAMAGDTKVLVAPGTITNTRSGDLQDQVTTAIFTRKDTTVDRDPWRDDSPFGPTPRYVDVSSDSVAQAAELVTDRDVMDDNGRSKYTDMPLGGTDTNRLKYTEASAGAHDGAGTIIHRQRTWVTEMVSE